MDFVINNNELLALSGLPHFQQLIYLRGIRPYMDVRTGLVGIKKLINYELIAKELAIRPQNQTESKNFSSDEIREAVSELERMGLIFVQSDDEHLVLRCNFASVLSYIRAS